MKITVKRHSGTRRRRDPESRDSPMCNCTSEVRSLTLALRNEVSILYLVGFLVGQIRDDIPFEHLLNQIERIHDLADLGDATVAKGVKNRDVELHDPVVAALAEEGPDKSPRPCRLRRQGSAPRSAFGNSGGGWSATSPRPLACRGGGPYAAGYRSARWRRKRRRRCSAPAPPRYRRSRMHRETSARAADEDPPPCFSPPVFGPTRIAASIVNRIAQGLVGKNSKHLTHADPKWFNIKGCIFE